MEYFPFLNVNIGIAITLPLVSSYLTLSFFVKYLFFIKSINSFFKLSLSFLSSINNFETNSLTFIIL